MGEFLLGCGSEYNTDGRTKLPIKEYEPMPEFYVDDKFQPYLDEFLMYAKDYGTDVSDIKYLTRISEVDYLGDGVLGKCIDWFHPKTGETVYREILIKKIDSRPIACLKMTVFHELGHCVLNKEHDPMGSNTIMEPYLSCDPVGINDNWDVLVEGFFK